MSLFITLSGNAGKCILFWLSDIHQCVLIWLCDTGQMVHYFGMGSQVSIYY